MNPELDKALVRDFPLLFAAPSRGRGPWKSGDKERFFGFECGDGWEPLIRRLAEKIEPALREIPSHVREDRAIWCFWAKEKYGGLRFTLCGNPDEPLYSQINAWIAQAEAESYRTCEACGAEGHCSSLRANRHYWIQTLCEAHHQEREALNTGTKLHPKDVKETPS